MANLGSLLYQVGVDTKDLGRAEGAVSNSAQKMKSEFDGIKATVATMFAGFAVGAGVKSLIDTSVELDAINTRLKFSVGGAQEAQKAWAFLREQAEKLGLSLPVAANTFSQFASAARGTALAGEPVKQVFRGVAEAISVMGLSNDQAEGAMLALTQMLSKGKVQAEELRGQLGERIPGAFQMAARAMNMTTAELDKFMADGKLMAEDFLPKFARQLSKEMASGLDESTQTMRANLNRLSNAWLDFKQTILSSGFTSSAILFIKDMTSYIKELGDEAKGNRGNLEILFNNLSQIGKAAGGIAMEGLKGVVSVLGEITSAYNALPDFIKKGLVGGAVAKGVGFPTPVAGLYGGALAVNEGLEEVNQKVGISFIPTVQSLSKAYFQLATYLENTVQWAEKLAESASKTPAMLPYINAPSDRDVFGSLYAGIEKAKTMIHDFRKVEEESVKSFGKQTASNWQKEFLAINDTLEQLNAKRSKMVVDPLSRKAGGNDREDTELRIKNLLSEQAVEQERINSLLEERDNAQSDYAAYLADKALQEEQARAAFIQETTQRERQLELARLVADVQEKATMGKLSEKEVQDNLTRILKDQQETSSNINNLTFEREKIERQLKASQDPNEWYAIKEAMSQVDKQLIPAKDHLESIRTALSSIEASKTIAVDADIKKATAKRDELLVQFEVFGKEIKINISNEEAKEKIKELGRTLKEQGIFIDGAKVSEGVAQGIYVDMEKVLSQPLPKGLFVIEAQIAKSPPQPFAQGLQSIIDDFESIPDTTIVLNIDSMNAFSNLKNDIAEISQSISINLDDSSAVPLMNKLLEGFNSLSDTRIINIDTSQAQAQINSLRSQLASINGMRSEYTVEGYWQSSPRVPFSQGYSELLKKLLSLPTESQYTIKSDGITGYMHAVNMESFGRENYNVLPQIPGADPQIYQMLMNAIKSMKAYLDQPSPFLYGNTASPMAYDLLDKIPALEAAARISTGKAQDIRIGDIVIHFSGADEKGNIDIEGLMAEIEKKLKENLKSSRSRIGGIGTWG